MLRSKPRIRLAAGWLLAALIIGAFPAARADEGLWPLDRLPLDSLQARYGFRPTARWIEHVQKASVDFGGGSGAFVSPDGLVLTNHHVALNQLQKMSSAEQDFVGRGFYARDRSQEVKCPDLELRVLMSTEDVTERVRRAIRAGAPEPLQNAQRKAAIAAIEQESTRRTGLFSRVIELHRGGEYRLYRFKKYTDVRLVMAPEQRIAFFGGDWDNFCFPRHDLDIAFFRVYENGQPLRPSHWFRWSAAGPREGEVVFTSGHPGSTGRWLTVAQLEYLRDAFYPARLRIQEHRLAALRAFAERSPESARRAADRIFGLENNLKRQYAFLGVLKDPAVMESKDAAEREWRRRVEQKPALAAACGEAWDNIAAAERELTRRHREWIYRDLARGARLVGIAEHIVRLVAEIEKPNDRRFAEYRDSRLESLRRQLFSPAPQHAEVDAVVLAAQLEDALEALGPDDPFVERALGGRAPRQVATEMMEGTKLADVAERRRLVEGGRTTVESSTDPLIVWARGLDPIYRELRAWHEDEIESVEALEGAKIARARFALDGRSIYPDATGTLRLSFGKVGGYEELTTQVPWKTTFYGLFERAAAFDRREPFDLPERVAAARDRLDLGTPLNFVAAVDIIGGSSGSPVLNRSLEYVGIIFDGNAHAYAWNYVYDQRQARAVAVHSSGILEALRKIYDLEGLADELTRSGRLSSETGSRDSPAAPSSAVD